ncbi:ABC transporter permease [Mesorhizobium sp. L-8-10]|nr:ABC transporter permease [Mesorhizobium sp. L-8-10]
MADRRDTDPPFADVLAAPPTRMSLPTIAATAAVIAALYFGREVFLPLAVALLLTFALAPVVAWLRRFGIPRIAAVVASVFSAFAAVALFSFVLAVQVTELAHNITLYQSNILTKVRTLKDTGASGGIVDRLTGVIERVGREIEAEEQPAATGEAEREPLPVEIVSRQKPLDVLLSMLTPLFGPLATTGLIIVVVIFMLLEREDLRDRFIRLVGYGDLHRTTQALEDAGGRVGQYLLAQLLVNTAYAIPVAIGLWLLGIPNAPLWGLLALVLRFVPFIGPVIAMLLPLFLAVAVAPGWSLVLWTAALFIVMELVINNVVEPYVYGSRTGLSPLAIIVAAIFWTWLWGPLGLVLSTPLTVCLVVLGRHVPQFEFLDVLFGNEPVLEPHARLYQRLLAGDPDEATDHAEDFLEEGYLVDFYRTVAVPALLLGEHDRARGVMTEAERRRMASSALTMVANLEDIVREEADEEEADDEDNGLAEEAELPDGTGMTVCCAGGRGELDDAAAAMLAQVLEVQGATVSRLSFAEIEPGNIRSLDLKEVDTIVIGFLNMDSMNHARFLVRRLKRARRGLRVGIVYWSDAGTSDNKALVEMAGVINADFVAQGMLDAVTGALSDTPAVPLKLPTRARRRAPARKKAKAAAEG